MMVLEILAIAIANYFTSAPELIRPTHLQLNQVRNLISFIHQSFVTVVDLILSKLPADSLNNQWSTKLQEIVK
jgi:hypothetical protein